MMPTPTTLLLAAAVLALAGTARAADPPEELIRRMLHTVPTGSFKAKAKLSSGGGWVRELEMSHKPTKEGEATFLEVTAPADVKDTRFLLLERKEGQDRQFIYMPTVRRAIEVMDESRKQPFLGSDFYVSDLAAPDVTAFTYTAVGDEEVNGRRCKLIEAVPKEPANEVYGKTVFAVDPADLLMVRAQFFDQKGKLFKVWSLGKVEKIDGILTPLEQSMENVQKNSKSRLEITEIKFNADVPDEVFSRQHLTR
jgi:hypothetical protein